MKFWIFINLVKKTKEKRERDAQYKEVGPVEISKKYSEPKTEFYEILLIETENRITEYRTEYS
jgi:hypothetical protein